jgi:hypothetical protein
MRDFFWFVAVSAFGGARDKNFQKKKKKKKKKKKD